MRTVEEGECCKVRIILPRRRLLLLIAMSNNEGNHTLTHGDRCTAIIVIISPETLLTILPATRSSSSALSFV
jgi:hypothetical protein